jgi:hypothetical protein
MHSLFRSFLSSITALLLALSCFAFQSPLSEESVREAYFLGQRRDEALTRFLDKYTQYLAAPKTGPHISSITFFTPFALLAHHSSKHSAGYSAQQAQLDHRNQAEMVEVIVQIQFTPSYGAVIPRPTSSRSGSPVGYAPRPYDFWKDFEVQTYSGDAQKALKPFSSLGDPNFSCSEDGGCSLTGATLYFEFPADAFTSSSATVQVNPPEGDPVTVDFDLASLR